MVGDLVAAAIMAPSMLNSQPWRFRFGAASQTIGVYADPARRLPCSDPDGRALHIACGAALLNLRLAAAVAGRHPLVELIPEPHQRLLLATIRLAAPGQASEDELELYAAIAVRRTNRGPFSSQALPPGIRAELAAAAQREGAVLHFPDQPEAGRLLRLAREADRGLLADPAYRAELTRWVGGRRDRDGIPDEATGPYDPRGSGPVRDFTTGQQQPQRYAWFEEEPQLGVLSTADSRRKDWLEAGQALERAWLTATARGLAVCPLTQPLETSDAWLARDTRSGVEHPQMILRLGYGLPVPRAPRRPVSTVLDICPED